MREILHEGRVKRLIQHEAKPSAVLGDPSACCHYEGKSNVDYIAVLLKSLACWTVSSSFTVSIYEITVNLHASVLYLPRCTVFCLAVVGYYSTVVG